MKRAGNAISVIVYAVIFAVVIGAVALIIAFVNNGAKNFYVQYGDEKISYKTENVELPKDAYSLFYCKNVFGLTDKTEKAKNFTVQIVFNENNMKDCDMTEFAVDGKALEFYRIDFTDCFNLKLYDGYFTLYLPQTLTLGTLLSVVYPDNAVTGFKDIDLYEKDRLSIVVYSEEEQATVTINFH